MSDTKSYTVRGMTPEEYQQMREAAAKQAQSINQWILETIRKRLKK